MARMPAARNVTARTRPVRSGVGIFLLVDGVLAIIASIFGKGEGRGLIALVGVLARLPGSS